MSAQNPQFESVDGGTDAATGGYSGNGTQPDDGAVALADANAAPEGEATNPEAETSEAVAAETDAATEAAVEAQVQPAAEGEPQPAAEGDARPVAEGEFQPAAEGDAQPDAQPIAEGELQPATEGDAQPVAEAEAQPAAEADAQPVAEADGQSTDDGSGFLAALAQAMQATAETERAKITDDMASRRETYVSAIHARREAEASRIRELADQDRKTIEAWAEAERQHIQLEHERRTQALQRDLEASLAIHGAKMDQEVNRVEVAIASYQAEVDGFFGRLERETDPVAIAQQAARRPAFPDLDAAGAPAADDAGSPAAATGDPAIGVMDQVAKNAGPWPSWTQTPAGSEPAVLQPAADAPIGDGTASQPVTASVAGNNDEASRTIVQSMPVSRPMSWLRRDRESNEGAPKEK